MSLKTSCKGCIFQGESCDKGIPVFIENGIQHTNGFCSIKRGKRWKAELGGESVDKAISRENKSLCMIVIDTEDYGFKATIPMVENYLGEIGRDIRYVNINNIIFVTKSNDNNFIKDQASMMSNANFGCKWHLEVLSDDSYSHDQMVDFVAMLPKESDNLLVVTNTLEFDLNQLKSAFYNMSSGSNIVAHIWDKHNYLINKFAYKNLLGNAEENIVEKIKKFDNWRSVCVEMTPQY